MRRGVTAAIIALAFGAAACSAVRPKLQVGAIEQTIVRSSRETFPGAVVGRARCPSGRVQRQGDTFVCTVPIDGQLAHFRVRQRDAHGTVDAPRLVERYVLARDLEEAIAAEVRTKELLDASADCSQVTVVIVAAPRTVRCTAQYAPDVVRHVELLIGADAQVRAVRFAEALLSTFRVGGEISQRLSATRGFLVYVECGDRQVVLPVGKTLRCQGADGVGAPLFPIVVTVTSSSGRYTFSPSR